MRDECFCVVCLLAIVVLYSVVVYLVDLHHTCCEIALACPEFACGIEEAELTGTLLFVLYQGWSLWKRGNHLGLTVRVLGNQRADRADL